MGTFSLDVLKSRLEWFDSMFYASLDLGLSGPMLEFNRECEKCEVEIRRLEESVGNAPHME